MSERNLLWAGTIRSRQPKRCRLFLQENQGSLPVSDKTAADEIARLFGVSKGNFKKAIGGLYKQGRITIHPDRIERA